MRTNTIAGLVSEPQKQTNVNIRWLIRRDMAAVLKIEHESFEFPWMVEVFASQQRRLGFIREGLAYEQWRNQWASPVTCCIHAGLDMAVSPSAGVLGFTVGDLRRMYPEGFPEWLTSRFDGDLAELPDEIGVWL